MLLRGHMAVAGCTQERNIPIGYELEVNFLPIWNITTILNSICCESLARMPTRFDLDHLSVPLNCGSLTLSHVIKGWTGGAEERRNGVCELA